MISLPNFTIGEQIHEGSRTRVYRGVRQEQGEPVILKTPQDDTPSLQQYARWTNEHTILGQLESPSTPRVLALEMAHNRPVLVLEDIGGTSLAALLSQGRLSFAQRLELAI